MSLPSPLLVVTDRHGSDRPLVETVRAVCAGGARWVWFRDRDLEPAARHDLAAALVSVMREAGGRLTIGGDAALAAAIGADGVHLGGSVEGGRPPSNSNPHPEAPASAGLEGGLQGSPRNLEGSFEDDVARRLRMKGRGGEALQQPAPASAALSILERVAAARRLLGPNGLVGLSAHSLADLRAAARAGADYATLSPIFASASKPGYGPALGLGVLREAAILGIQIVALGGIGPDEARACRAAGAAGVAVMGGLMRASDPAGRTRAFLDALG